MSAVFIDSYSIYCYNNNIIPDIGGKNMIECKHVFEGNKDGVKCRFCGKQMTAAEYVKFLKPKKAEPKTETKKK